MKTFVPFTMLVSSALAGCADTAPESPVVNPDPARIVRIHGTADPSLTIHISTQHLSTEKKCARKGTGAAATLPQSVRVDSSVTRSGNEYESHVALDHFEEGGCGWKPFVIGFQVANEQGTTTGHFATGAQGTQLVPGPENKVWISRPGQLDWSGKVSSRQGASAIRPLDLNCAQIELRGATALSCVTDSPRELPLISDQARDVRVNFRDVTGQPRP